MPVARHDDDDVCPSHLFKICAHYKKNGSVSFLLFVFSSQYFK